MNDDAHAKTLRSAPRDSAALAMLLLAVLVLATVVFRQRAAMAAFDDQTRAHASAHQLAEVQEQVLISALDEVTRRATPCPLMAMGSDTAALPKEVTCADAETIYILSPECDACPLNFPELNRRHQAGHRVVAISRSGTPSQLAAYAREHELSFPIMRATSGLAFDMVHDITTAVYPITLSVSNGTLVSLAVGRLRVE